MGSHEAAVRGSHLWLRHLFQAHGVGGRERLLAVWVISASHSDSARWDFHLFLLRPGELDSWPSTPLMCFEMCWFVPLKSESPCVAQSTSCPGVFLNAGEVKGGEAPCWSTGQPGIRGSEFPLGLCGGQELMAKCSASLNSGGNFCKIFCPLLRGPRGPDPLRFLHCDFGLLWFYNVLKVQRNFSSSQL